MHRPHSPGAAASGRERRVKLQAILREVWRDIASGTARTRGFALVAAVIVASSAAADLFAVHQLAEQAREFHRSGASTSILTMGAAIDGERCDSLARMPGVRAAGA